MKINKKYQKNFVKRLRAITKIFGDDDRFCDVSFANFCGNLSSLVLLIWRRLFIMGNNCISFLIISYCLGENNFSNALWLRSGKVEKSMNFAIIFLLMSHFWPSLWSCWRSSVLVYVKCLQYWLCKRFETQKWRRKITKRRKFW